MRLALTLAAAAVAATTLGVSAPRAQEAPAVDGPYYLIDVTRDSLMVAAGGTVRKSGSIASITMVMGSPPAMLAASGIARMDMNYQFNCRSSTYRTDVAAAYGADGRLLGVIDNATDWEAVNLSASAGTMMALACDGTIPDDSELEGDPNTIVAGYRDFIVEQ